MVVSLSMMIPPVASAERIREALTPYGLYLRVSPFATTGSHVILDGDLNVLDVLTPGSIPDDRIEALAISWSLKSSFGDVNFLNLRNHCIETVLPSEYKFSRSLP